MYILVVDDDHFANTLVQFVLRKEGHEVDAADNPRGALHIIQRREPDLLLLDIGLPSMNGFELSAKLREEGYEIPLIFITANDTTEAKLQGFNNGADDYLCKPYDHQELVARVQAFLCRHKPFSVRVSRVATEKLGSEPKGLKEWRRASRAASFIISCVVLWYIVLFGQKYTDRPS